MPDFLIFGGSFFGGTYNGSCLRKSRARLLFPVTTSVEHNLKEEKYE
jgi:hypothetical protein